MTTESQGFEQTRAWDRTRHRLRRASSALWLEVDRLST